MISDSNIGKLSTSYLRSGKRVTMTLVLILTCRRRFYVVLSPFCNSHNHCSDIWFSILLWLAVLCINISRNVWKLIISKGFWTSQEAPSYVVLSRLGFCLLLTICQTHCPTCRVENLLRPCLICIPTIYHLYLSKTVHTTTFCCAPLSQIARNFSHFLPQIASLQLSFCKALSICDVIKKENRL